MYDRVLVPTDGSPGMKRVVAHAGSLAEIHGATLELVYVVNSSAVANLPMESSWEGVAEMLREEGENALEAAAKQADSKAIQPVRSSSTPSGVTRISSVWGPTAAAGSTACCSGAWPNGSSAPARCPSSRSGSARRSDQTRRPAAR